MEISSTTLAATATNCLKSGDEAGATRALLALSDLQDDNSATAMPAVQIARALDRNDIALRILSPLRSTEAIMTASLQLRQELGEPVADELLALRRGALRPDGFTLQLVGALHAEGRFDEAISLLDALLKRQGLWIPGHQTLANLRWQFGENSSAHDSFAEATRLFPQSADLWAAWAASLNSAGQAHESLRVIAAARAAGATGSILDMIESESCSLEGDTRGADSILARLAAIEAPDFEASRMRHAMRYSRFDAAIEIGTRALSRTFHGECWAWLGAAWKAVDDPRSDWFYRGLDLIGTYQLHIGETQHQSLLGTLQGLHGQSAQHPLNQSPRGGTQTMGPLFKRGETELRALRTEVLNAVRSYMEGLPPQEAGHPFLAAPRRGVKIEGSWSVRLRPHGCHVAHIHSHGWISSALYLALPPETSDAEQQAGWFEVGTPLLPERWDKPPLSRIQPLVGKLVLFPSLFWHRTVPFETGERLTIAFDIVPA